MSEADVGDPDRALAVAAAIVAGIPAVGRIPAHGRDVVRATGQWRAGAGETARADREEKEACHGAASHQ